MPYWLLWLTTTRNWFGIASFVCLCPTTCMPSLFFLVNLACKSALTIERSLWLEIATLIGKGTSLTTGSALNGNCRKRPPTY